MLEQGRVLTPLLQARTLPAPTVVASATATATPTVAANDPRAGAVAGAAAICRLVGFGCKSVTPPAPPLAAGTAGFVTLPVGGTVEAAAV